jgi:hypothetical protein
MRTIQTQRLLEAINYRGVVSGYTHDFYGILPVFHHWWLGQQLNASQNQGTQSLTPFQGEAQPLLRR